jgi:LysR family transcriptional regulator, carnitine catabolism transcriptional activator
MIDGMRHIKAFLAVARLGNFTRASIELNVSQPALTVQIKQLEAALCVSVFDRNKRKVELTQAGRDLLLPLERILIDVESVMSATHDLRGLRRGLVTVAAMPSIAAKLLPLAISDLSESYPGVLVRMRDVVAGNMVQLVKAGEVDFGIGSQLRDDKDIITRHLFTEQICVFARKKHPLARKRSISLRELTDYPVILTEKDTSVRLILERALEQQRLSLRALHETNHMSTAIGMVNCELGVAILPLAARDCGPCEDIRCIPIQKPALAREIGIVSKVGKTFSKASETLIGILQRLARRSYPQQSL